VQLFFDFGSIWVVPKFPAVRFLPFLAHMGPFLVFFWLLEVGHSGEKLNLLANQKLAFASNFCEPNFQEFRLK